MAPESTLKLMDVEARLAEGGGGLVDGGLVDGGLVDGGENI